MTFLPALCSHLPCELAEASAGGLAVIRYVVLATSCSALVAGVSPLLLPCAVWVTVAVPQQGFTSPGGAASLALVL